MRAPKYHPKTLEQYRQLAEKCREAARTVSAEHERAEFLARAQTWDVIADRVGVNAHSERKSQAKQIVREIERCMFEGNSRPEALGRLR